MGLVALTTLGLAAEAAWLVWTGQPAAAVPLAAAAIYLGHILGLSTRIWWRPWPSRQPGTLTTTPDGTTGVRFRYSGWPYYWLTAILVLTVLVVLVVALGAALSATLIGVVVAVVLGVLALWMGWFLVTMLRLAPGSLIVSPTGVAHRSLTSTCFIPWHAIVAVTADWLGTPIIAVKAFPSADTRVRRYLGRFGSGELQFWPIVVVRTGWLASDPTTVYHALSFYHAHPELRAELATPQALRRIGTR
jgi:amino acid transporter